MLRTLLSLVLAGALLPTAALAQKQPAAIPCPDFGDGPAWDWRLRAMGGGGQTTQEYDMPDSALVAYRNLRDGTEQLLITPRGGLRLEMTHRSGLSLRLGGDYHLYRTITRNTSTSGPPTAELVEVRTPDGVLIRTDTVFTASQTTSEIYNRHHTLALTGGVGFHRWFGRLAPYVFAEAGYEFRVGTRGALPLPALPGTDPASGAVLVDSEPLIAKAPGFQIGGTVGLDYALTGAWFVGPSVSYTALGGLGSGAEPLGYDQRALTAAVNVGLRF